MTPPKELSGTSLDEIEGSARRLYGRPDSDAIRDAEIKASAYEDAHDRGITDDLAAWRVATGFTDEALFMKWQESRSHAARLAHRYGAGWRHGFW